MAVRFASVAEFREMVTVPGVGPLAVADSHDPPEVVAAAAVKLRPAVPLTLTDCDAGVEPPT